MRSIMMAAGLVTALALAGCDSGGDKAGADQTAAAAPKPKSLGRQRQMYQGQEPIAQVASGAVTVSKSNPANLELTAQGSTATAGWSRASFLPRIYPAAPKDGIYEVDVVAQKPDGAAAQVVTPIEVKGEWPGYPSAHLKGVKFIAAGGDVTAMLAAPAP
ncbi:MAG: hypothetical protein ABW042_06070 [Phenylobacterium sp.]